MKLICNKAYLIDIINTVQRSISAKSTLEILECIKIDADASGTVIFTGNNLDLCIEYTAHCAVQQGGTIALASRMFGEIVRKLPDGDVTIQVNDEHNITTIQSGSSKFNIQGLSAADYPDAPLLMEQYRFSIPQSTLKRFIRKTISFVSVNETRKPVQTGALFELTGTQFRMVASDGHRLAVVSDTLPTPVPDHHFVVPGSTLREMLKLLKEDDTAVSIIVADRNVQFDFGDYQIYTRLLDGEFLRYSSILSVVNSITLTVDRTVLSQSLERALLLINDDIANKTDNKVPVRFNIGYDQIAVSCITARGQVNDSVPAEISGDGILIGFNCRFLLDALAACDEDMVALEFSAPTSGCFIKPLDGSDSYIYMVLPVRLD